MINQHISRFHTGHVIWGTLIHTKISDPILFVTGIPSFKELVDVAAIVRDQVNGCIFIFALSAAILRRRDTRQFRIPPICELLPDRFIGNFEILRFDVSARESLCTTHIMISPLNSFSKVSPVCAFNHMLYI